ncbi:Calx-beta domain-containing protein, partial [Acinetobacter sp. 163]|nr:Calx-beta domain-containing protein [Acinetobacter sp. 163]
GMVGFENSNYTMNENETKTLKLVRVGGSSGKLTVTAQPNPGSAIQDDYNTTLIPTVTFEDGETEKTVNVETRRNTNKTGDQYF